MQTDSVIPYVPSRPVRFVTATALFDGHDASINIMRRLLQATGVEVVHLGHNRSVDTIVSAALQEDVDGIAVSSYQGGHVEFFGYMIAELARRGGESIKVFGGGGGVIVPSEIAALQQAGVCRIYSVDDGRQLGLQGMINDMVARCDNPAPEVDVEALLAAIKQGDRLALARLISAADNGRLTQPQRQRLLDEASRIATPVLGVTGTGGAGKSSLTDELINRFRIDQNEGLNLAVISIDPSRKKSGGALLGDRIRMNAIDHPRIYMRSLATRHGGKEISTITGEAIAACRLAGFDLIVVETSGIGQGDAAIVDYCDLSLYVMTPEFGAASQLEKIDMLDFADLVAINKCDRKGAEDALRDVRKQVQRNRQRFEDELVAMPVYGTVASRFNDDGVTALYHGLAELLRQRGMALPRGRLPTVTTRQSSAKAAIVPAERARYLADIAATVRAYHNEVAHDVELARERQALTTTERLLGNEAVLNQDLAERLKTLIAERSDAMSAGARQALASWPAIAADRQQRPGYTSLSGLSLPRVALPRFEDEASLLAFLRREHLPGYFPFTAGVFAFKRDNEDPTRMFAGEGDAFRTNRRFHAIADGMAAKRLSTAFDSVTLYGCDPDLRPDIYGKIGNSGVSIATIDDLAVLYSGFDLCDAATSVSMTINGPAPVILAMYLNVAIDQQMARYQAEHGQAPTAAEAAQIRANALATVRGTVQADILKEDQGQNTCIFSTEFALKMMGDIQAYFIDNGVRYFYSVSISGYHIAEAGANPISQLAFTLANGFTYVEAYLARGMDIDAFAPNLSFFFSNGMDPEYTVLGRVARRIWAIAMQRRYGANERSQKLKYHIQTSGRSLHAQEIDFNDIRTTLQALIAVYDHCNSLHTNAFDEAITTPTPASLRRAMAIQLIINREWGLAKNENPNQGSFVIDELTDLVEEAVLKLFDAISERGGVLGAMETGYQRGKIQDESLDYERKKHDGSHPIVGVNTFIQPDGGGSPDTIELARSSEDEKQSQLKRLASFHQQHRDVSAHWLARLSEAAIANDNLFAVLMEAVRHCSLGQITQTLYAVGGQYRRHM